MGHGDRRPNAKAAKSGGGARNARVGVAHICFRFAAGQMSSELEERVVGRDGAVTVDAQHLAEQVAQGLCVTAVGVVADGDVELAVGPEVDGAAVMVRGRAEVVQFQDDRLASRHRHVAIRGESADAVVDRRRGRGVIDVHILIAGEVRIEGHAQQAALTGGVDGEGDEVLREQGAVLDHPQPSALLADEQPPVGREGHRRRIREPGDDERFGVTGGKRRGEERKSERDKEGESTADVHQQPPRRRACLPRRRCAGGRALAVPPVSGRRVKRRVGSESTGLRLRSATKKRPSTFGSGRYSVWAFRDHWRSAASPSSRGSSALVSNTAFCHA